MSAPEAARPWGSFPQGRVIPAVAVPSPVEVADLLLHRLLFGARPKIRGPSFTWEFVVTETLVLTLSGLAPDLGHSLFSPRMLHHLSRSS